MKLSGMKTSNDGIITLPALAKNKIKIISGMDLTNIAERLKYANKNLEDKLDTKIDYIQLLRLMV